MPFADAASDNLPLSRLLRLSLFQISVGMAMVMLVGATATGPNFAEYAPMIREAGRTGL